MREKQIKAQRIPITKQTMLISLLAGFVVAIGAGAVWQSIERNLRSHVVSATKHASQSIEILIREDLKNRTSMLKRMANRWSATNGTSRMDWNVDASSYFDNTPGFQAIEWADANSKIQWIYPLKGNEVAQGYDLRRAPELVSESLAAIRETSEAVFTKPVELTQGGLGIAIYLPVSKNSEFDGFIIGVLRLEDWVNTIFERLSDLDGSVQLLVEGHVVYSNDQSSNSDPSEWTLNQSFNVFGLRWGTTISPQNDFVLDAYSHVLTALLIGIILLSSIIALLTFLTLASRQRSREFYVSANQLSVFFQNLPGIAFRCTNEPSGQMEFISDGCEELTGFSVSDFLTQRIGFGSLIHTDDSEHRWQATQRAITAKGVYNIDYRITTKLNEEKWLWERGQAVSSEGSDIAHIEGIISDISDRKNTEAELADLVQFSKAIVETAAEAVITLDSDARVEELNHETELMFRCSRDELIGRNVRTLITKPYLKRTNLIIDELNANFPPLKPLTRKITMRRLNGSSFPVIVTMSQVKRRETQKYVVLIKDLSEQKLAEKEAHEHLGKLAHIARTNMLGEMTTGIAHEINQPLTAISVFSQAGKRLLESGKIENVSKVFDKLSVHAQRAGEIIERIQALTRQEPGALVSADCNTLVRQIATLAEAESHMYDIPIALKLEKGLAKVSVDPVQIQQVVLNLLRNGMEAMGSHQCAEGNTIEIVTKTHDKEYVEIAIIDSGIGVSKEVEESLFTTFSTTKSSGLGMGLSISRSIMEAHGGSLNFRNNGGCGATFFITLPSTKKHS